MNFEEKVKVVEELKKLIQKTEADYNKMCAAFGDLTYTYLCEWLCNCQTMAIKGVCSAIRDNENSTDGYSWLEWFIFENDWGKNRYPASNGKVKYKEVRTIVQLIKLIEAGYDD